MFNDHFDFVTDISPHRLKTDMSAIPKVARGDSEMFERSFDDSDLE